MNVSGVSSLAINRGVLPKGNGVAGKPVSGRSEPIDVLKKSGVTFVLNGDRLSAKLTFSGDVYQIKGFPTVLSKEQIGRLRDVLAEAELVITPPTMAEKGSVEIIPKVALPGGLWRRGRDKMVESTKSSFRSGVRREIGYAALSMAGADGLVMALRAVSGFLGAINRLRMAGQNVRRASRLRSIHNEIKRMTADYDKLIALYNGKQEALARLQEEVAAYQMELERHGIDPARDRGFASKIRDYERFALRTERETGLLEEKIRAIVDRVQALEAEATGLYEMIVDSLAGGAGDSLGEAASDPALYRRG